MCRSTMTAENTNLKILLYNSIGYMLENGMTTEEVAEYLGTNVRELEDLEVL